MRIRLAFTASFVAIVGLAACGGGDTAAPSNSTGDAPGVTAHEMSSMPSTGDAGGTFSDADVVFAQGMIPHHEGAIEMSDIALDPTVGASPEIQALARQIKAAQDPEIDQMTALLKAWGQPVAMDMTPEEMADMEGMMSMEDMESLGSLTGPAFDTAWAAMMIEHHRGAIVMAETVKSSGSNPEVLALADAIIAGQSAEIAVLQPLAG